MFAQYLSRVMEKHRLGNAEMEEAMELVMEGAVPPVQVAAFLAALRARGETPAMLPAAVFAHIQAHRLYGWRPSP